MPINYPISWPAGIGTTPNTNSVKLRGISTVGISASPFTGTTQVQEWPGELWMADCSFPPMLRPEAEVWLSWGLSLRGRSGTFMFGDPAGRTPRGTAPGTAPRTGGGNTAGSKVLLTTDWTPSQTGILLPGDYIQIAKNQLLFPIGFDVANWVKNQCTVGAPNAITDPLGTTTAERLTPTGGATNAYCLQERVPGSLAGPIVCAGKTFIFSVWLKAASGTPSIDILLLDQTGGSITGGVTHCSLTTSWQRFTTTGTFALDDTGLQAAIGGAGSWVAAEGAVDMWGASLTSDTVDGELKKVLTATDSDVNGDAAIDIFPRLRSIDSYSRIITANPRGVFRLTDNKMEWDYDRLKMYGISFSAAEAL